MIYEKNSSNELQSDLFKNPTSEYRGAPFWAWNCKLDPSTLTEQIEYLHKMGFGGFHMHSRTGMSTPYLSDEFMKLIKLCTDEAKKKNMLAYLYDEDRWPSGAAGGFVTKNPQYRAKRITFSNKLQEHFSYEEAVNEGKPYLLATFDILFDDDGKMLDYKRINEQQQAENEKWYMYVKTPLPNPWFNNQTYIDTLDKKAVDKFIDVTYTAYEKAVGNEFGKTIKSIFTDEPAFSQGFYDSNETAVFAWTHSITTDFKKKYGYDICDKLPEILWEKSNGEVSATRYRYHDMVAEKFASSFADNCGKWCKEHGIEFTGHLVEEPQLFTQTKSVGETMRFYRGFGIPGIDMLCNAVELTTAKQCQSSVHQYGCEAMLSELYGVTNWDFDFRGHKFQGDWQAALGVTIRVPHLSWVSMAGEAKRDYPASINYQSPWFEEYKYVEDHFARVNTALTRGKSVVKVGVIHPIESMWLNYGINKNTADIRLELDEKFENITKWLLTGTVDFDFICESTLQSQQNGAKVGEMCYSVILVPGCLTLRQSTIDFLKKFSDSGNEVIFVGNCPHYTDAVESNSCAELYEKCTNIPFERTPIINALEKYRDIKICEESGELTSNLIYNMRDDNDCKWLFIAHIEQPKSKEDAAPQNIVITLTGQYIPTLYNSLDGSTKKLDCTQSNGKTILHYAMYQSDSLLLKIKGGKMQGAIEKANENKHIKDMRIVRTVQYERSEPNVLLLDRAEYSLDGEAFSPEEEILILDNVCRKRLNLPLRTDAFPQPWISGDSRSENTLTLRFSFESEIELPECMLAIEDAENLEITLNGKAVDNTLCGYYVDKAIKTVKLKNICIGKNVLTVKMPFGRCTNTEWCYILGEFNVQMMGACAVITKKTEKIGFSDITAQGMPFYGGNIKYYFDIETPDCMGIMQLSYYRGALVKVYVDGEDKGILAYAPYEVNIGKLSSGKHKVELVLFGNRVNTFGGVHNILMPAWVGPTYWRSEGTQWGYEYNLKSTGLLTSPIFKLYEI